MASKQFKYDDSPAKPSKLKEVFTAPDKSKEKSIAEIFNLKQTDAPTEKHLERRNGLKEWGNKKPKK